MKYWVNYRRGFTIVELLIVIVVIGILAAITVTAYSGIQDRAEASKTANAIGAYKKALQLYKTANGHYPTTGAMCLGDKYTPFSGGTVPACRYSSSQIAVAGNAAARNELKELMGGLPMPSAKHIMNGSHEWVGGHFYGESYNYTLDGEPVVTIEYATNEDTCPVGPVYATGAPSFSSPAVERSAVLSSGGSRCIILLPN